MKARLTWTGICPLSMPEIRLASPPYVQQLRNEQQRLDPHTLAAVRRQLAVLGESFPAPVHLDLTQATTPDRSAQRPL